MDWKEIRGIAKKTFTVGIIWLNNHPRIRNTIYLFAAVGVGYLICRFTK